MLEIIKENSFTVHRESKPFLLSFLICDNCYWCASAIKSITVTGCPQCGKTLTIMMPISRPIQTEKEEEGIASV